MSDAQGSQKLILVVDDEPDVIAFLTTLLEDNGYKTVSARDGQEALDAVKNQKPDLISLDITMPEKSGVRFYREIKNDPDLKAIPVVIVTGVSDDFQKFISTRKQVPPPEGYISKPIEEPKYLDTIKGLIDS
ncbi:MAG: response regulator [Planctomycetota bacterium]|jgi:CheY-like chemotaxis protein